MRATGTYKMHINFFLQEKRRTKVKIYFVEHTIITHPRKSIRATRWRPVSTYLASVNGGRHFFSKGKEFPGGTGEESVWMKSLLASLLSEGRTKKLRRGAASRRVAARSLRAILNVKRRRVGKYTFSVNVGRPTFWNRAPCTSMCRRCPFRGTASTACSDARIRSAANQGHSLTNLGSVGFLRIGKWPILSHISIAFSRYHTTAAALSRARVIPRRRFNLNEKSTKHLSPVARRGGCWTRAVIISEKLFRETERSLDLITRRFLGKRLSAAWPAINGYEQPAGERAKSRMHHTRRAW